MKFAALSICIATAIFASTVPDTIPVSEFESDSLLGNAADSSQHAPVQLHTSKAVSIETPSAPQDADSCAEFASTDSLLIELSDSTQATYTDSAQGFIQRKRCLNEFEQITGTFCKGGDSSWIASFFKGTESVTIVCDKEFRYATELEKQAGLCDEKRRGKESSNLTCTDSGWKDTKSANTEGLVFEKGLPLSGKINPDYLYFQDTRDRLIYRAIKAADMTWMAENLEYVNSTNSDSTPELRGFYSWATAMDSSAHFSESGKGCGFGRLCHPRYPVRGICPEGWHLPDITESETLLNAEGHYHPQDSIPYNSLGWTGTHNTAAIHSYEDVLDSVQNNKHYPLEGGYVHFWNSTERDNEHAYYPALNYYGIYAGHRIFYKKGRLPVRCILDSGK